MRALPSAPVDESKENLVICRICCTAEQPDQLYRQSSFHVVRCKKCGTVFVQPVDRSVNMELEQQAAADGERYMRKVFIEREGFWARHWTERLRKVELLLGRKGCLLDVGCAVGHFQLVAESRGWTTVGVEYSQDQVNYAREVFGLDVHAGRFEEADFEPASFDLITLWSVIEHVADPRSFFARARVLLKPEGMLVLQTPNQSSLITSLAGLGYHLSGGRYFLPIYSLDHIFRFDEQTLRRLLEKSGFEVVKIEQYDNLNVMLARMALQPKAALRRISLAFLHLLAALLNRRNQLVAFARPALEARRTTDT
jgi:2-polyprenyl-3-methyl-5-hydroxy-6-metoxy-1,4-benzoquinol methylase